jgi:hypothetical protein
MKNGGTAVAHEYTDGSFTMDKWPKGVSVCPCMSVYVRVRACVVACGCMHGDYIGGVLGRRWDDGWAEGLVCVPGKSDGGCYRGLQHSELEQSRCLAP